jgi:hypothetical protein
MQRKETSMSRLWTPFLAALVLTVFQAPMRAADQPIAGPFIHHNLAIYLVHGNSSGGPVPLTLEEALLKKTATVFETGDVNMLEIENVGAEPIFVQSGEIVKGGQQDRALTASLLLPPHSGRIRVAAFCVEHGRWSARGTDDAATFSSAGAALPSREAKIAIKAPAPVSQPGAPAADAGRRQMEVWRNVTKIQERLSKNLNTPVASPESQTSLELALENDSLAKVEAEYLASLQEVGERDPDVIGFAFAINGKLNSADIYPSNGLFRKMWPKLIKAAAAEAISETQTVALEPPSTQAVASFLQTAEHGVKTNQEITQRVQLETRESPKMLYFETKSISPAAPSAFIHRNYLAK